MGATRGSGPRLGRTIILGSISLCASALGMLLARPIAAQFRTASPWVLPAIAVGVLALLVTAALLVLPSFSRSDPKR